MVAFGWFDPEKHGLYGGLHTEIRIFSTGAKRKMLTAAKVALHFPPQS
jgi:hypothetical protein